jgi:diguanylate cyclase (GGDEF)-like protein
MPPRERDHVHSGSAQSDVVAEWLGVDRKLLDGLEAEVVGRIADRREELIEARGTIAAYLDVSAVAQRTIQGLVAEARVDPLTRTLNRRGIDEDFERELRRSSRTGAPMSVIVIDIDGLKKVNDELGHAAGDELLRATASAVRSALRATDALGRTGGDEFLGVLPGADDSQAELIADRITVAVRDFRISAAPERRFDVSSGWASTSETQLGPSSLIKVADERLYARRRRRRIGVA